MRAAVFAALLVLSTVVSAHLAPLTVKEIALMLRTGYSAEAVQRELAARHLIGSIGAEEELVLTRANATPSLIAAIKSGTFAVPADEVAAAQAQLAAETARRAAEAERSRKMDTLYQEQLLKHRAAAPRLETKHAIGATLQNSLVAIKDGKAVPLDGDAAASKKLIAFYYSAHWCGPCREFTPKLVAFYNQVIAQHPEFEVVFVSNDHSRAEMEAYMRDAKMPWPAVDYDKIKGRADLRKLAGDSIPCLVVVDANSRVVSDSFAGKEYRGPQSVLQDLDQIFTNGTPPKLAQRQ